MEPFTQHRGRVAVLDWTDVNTDLIIPARYLKRIERVGYGPCLFADKRYEPGGAPAVDDTSKHGPEAADFPLNRPEAKGATVLVVRQNFGCGSSREHAVWAVQQAGYRAVIAPVPGAGFADIFEGNAYNSGLLPLELPQADWDAVADAGRQPGGAEVTVDLGAQELTIHPADGTDGRTIPVQIPEAQRQRLMKGLDAIAETLLHVDAIAAHEAAAPAWSVPQRKIA